MNILLDTNILIWFSQDDTALPDEKKQRIENPENTIHVSVATFWEIAIKKSLK